MGMKGYYAHVREDGKTQTVAEHLRRTAEKAAECLKECGLSNAGYLAGIVHDMGKYSPDFQSYIREGNASRRGSVIHSFQGCQFLLNQFNSSQDPYESFTAEIIAFAVGAHHGLFDCVGEAKDIGLQYRKEKDGIHYPEAVCVLSDEVITNAEIAKVFSAAVEEIRNVLDILDKNSGEDADYAFYAGLLARLLLSALIEGDRQDTAEFMNDVSFPQWPEDMRPIWQERLHTVEEKIAALSTNTKTKSETEKMIARARATISETCKTSADLPCGIYTLNVPTGGGKTLSSLRYAIAHAEKYNKRRIIFTSPLLSILEQNASVIRNFVGDDRLILEHHSNVVQDVNSQDKLDERELYIQTWNSPIILTTMVQMLNTLFDGKTSSIRRFHSLCDSIIVIDEVQTVPTKMLTLFNLAIQFISTICGATVVLCSATQPSLDKADHPLKERPKDLAACDAQLRAVFKRTRIEKLDDVTADGVPDLVYDLMEKTDSLLVVCNTKAEAAKLFRSIQAPDWNTFHLSAAMCVQHRRDTVDALKASLQGQKDALHKGPKTLCIATQVIEAGVDISFQSVLRLTAGMDSVIQAAGRCNRNGESDTPQAVYMVKVTDEKLGKLPEILRGKIATVALLDAFGRNPGEYGNDLASEAAIRFYYEKLYKDMDGEAQDFPIHTPETTLYDLLSLNSKYTDEGIKGIGNYRLWQAFKTAGQAFEVFDESATDVIVPYGEGKRIITELCSSHAKEDHNYREQLLKSARAYTVSVYTYQKERLLTDKAMYPICDDFAFALIEPYYNEKLGLVMDPASQGFLEV